MVSETESAYYSYCKYIFLIVKYCGIQYIYFITIHSIVVLYTKDGESPDYYFLAFKK